MVHTGTTRGPGQRACLYSRAAEKGSSQKRGFRCTEFSETQSVLLLILENPICRGNPMRGGPGLCTNSRTTFQCREFSETGLPIRGVLGNTIGTIPKGAQMFHK